MLSILAKYLVNSSFTFGYNNNKPIMFGKTSANIIASEKAQTEDISPAAPITINIKNRILYVRSETFPFPNTYIQD